MSGLTETTLEQTALDWFEFLGWQTAFGPDISPDGPVCERQDYDQVVLIYRLQIPLENIIPNNPQDATREAVRKITRTGSPSLIENNQRFHRMRIVRIGENWGQVFYFSVLSLNHCYKKQENVLPQRLFLNRER